MSNGRFSGRFSGRSVLGLDIPFRAGRDHWNGESFDPGVWLGAVEVPFVVAAAKREREVAQVPRRGTCKCVRAGSAVRELFRGRCATVLVGRRSETELLGLHGFGPRALGIIREALAAEGMSMRS